MTISLPDDVKQISWAAEQPGIGTSTAYQLVAAGKIPGTSKVGGPVADLCAPVFG